MREFVKDYVELQKHSNVWMKKHWKGWLLISVAYGVVYYGIITLINNRQIKQIKDLDSSIFGNEEES